MGGPIPTKNEPPISTLLPSNHQRMFRLPQRRRQDVQGAQQHRVHHQRDQRQSLGNRTPTARSRRISRVGSLGKRSKKLNSSRAALGFWRETHIPNVAERLKLNNLVVSHARNEPPPACLQLVVKAQIPNSYKDLSSGPRLGIGALQKAPKRKPGKRPKNGLRRSESLWGVGNRFARIEDDQKDDHRKNSAKRRSSPRCVASSCAQGRPPGFLRCINR